MHVEKELYLPPIDFNQLRQKATEERENCASYWDDIEQTLSQRRDHRSEQTTVFDLLYLLKDRRCEVVNVAKYRKEMFRLYKKYLRECDLDKALEIGMSDRKIIKESLKYRTFKRLIRELPHFNNDPRTAQEIEKNIMNYLNERTQYPSTLIEVLMPMNLILMWSKESVSLKEHQAEIQTTYQSITQVKRSISKRIQELPENLDNLSIPEEITKTCDSFLFEVEQTEAAQEKLKKLIQKLKLVSQFK